MFHLTLWIFQDIVQTIVQRYIFDIQREAENSSGEFSLGRVRAE